MIRHKYNEKTQKIIGSNTKVVPYALLIKELFHPKDETNQQTNVIYG